MNKTDLKKQNVIDLKKSFTISNEKEELLQVTVT